MKILFVLESYSPNIGGVETLFKNLVDSLNTDGNQILILTNKGPGGRFLSVEKSRNVTIRRYRFFNRYLFTVLAFFPSWYHSFRYDFIQTTSYNAALPAYLAGLLSGRKVFITFHEYWGNLWFTLPYFRKWNLYLHYLFERILTKLPFYRFIAVSDHTHDRLIEAGIPPEKVVRIYNGIDYSQWISATPGSGDENSRPYQFIYFGRLGISKGLDILLNAAGQLKLDYPDFVLNLVISRDPSWLLQEIKLLITLHELEKNVKMHHHVSKEHLMELVSRSDAVVIPSYNEGFCFTAVESIALGKPVISSGKGALSEVVTGKYLVMSEFSAAGLRMAMRAGISGLWQEKPMKRFHLSDTVDQYIELYRKLES